jgi:hypothetical protein
VGWLGDHRLHSPRDDEQQPFDSNNFLIYLVYLTIAPAFLSASVYLCLSRIVIIYGENVSRFRPRTYTLFFTCCDFFSLLLQAIGGAIASIATDYNVVSIRWHSAEDPSLTLK